MFLCEYTLLTCVVLVTHLMTVHGVDINPFIQPNRTFDYAVSLRYRIGKGIAESRECNRRFKILASDATVNVADRPEVEAYKVRVQPQVSITGPNIPNALYTLVLAEQPEKATSHATPTRPVLHFMESDIEVGRTSGLIMSTYLPFLPTWTDRVSTLVLLYRQSGLMPNSVHISSFTENECEIGPQKCLFDIQSLASNLSMVLEFAGTFSVMTDRYSAALAADKPFIPNGCEWLDKVELRGNPLVGEKAFELNFNVMAKFKTPGTLIGPLCGQVFRYEDDMVEVTTRTGMPIPARQTRTVPWVFYHRRDKYDESWKEDWYTVAYVSQIQIPSWPEGGSPERPLLLWLVTNIKGNDVTSGKCVVPYHAPTPFGTIRVAMLLFKQEDKVEINPAEYSEYTCLLQYRCSFNVLRMAQEKKLTLVGAQDFHITSDPWVQATLLEYEEIKESDACPVLEAYRDEGKMLGQCLPKFTSWKETKEKMEKSEEVSEKKMLMEKMKEMCPELAEEVGKGQRIDKDDMISTMKQWLMEQIMKKHWEMHQRKKQMDARNSFMQKLLQNMIGDKMGDMDNFGGI